MIISDAYIFYNSGCHEILH